MQLKASMTSGSQQQHAAMFALRDQLCQSADLHGSAFQRMCVQDLEEHRSIPEVPEKCKKAIKKAFDADGAAN